MAKEKSEELLVPLEEYVKSGIYLGTRVITSFMKPYVYRRRPDGLATINTQEIDDRLKVAINFLSRYPPEEILVVCKRESGWQAAELFGKLTGIRVFTKKYPPGIITNPSLPDFFEPSILFIVDPWLDKNPLKDALKLNIPVISLCDTNNITSFIDLIIPCNNKSNKSIGLVFWILAQEYTKKLGIKAKIPPLSEFTREKE